MDDNEPIPPTEFPEQNCAEMVAEAIKSNQAVVKVNLNLCNPNRNLSTSAGPVQCRLLLSAEEYD